MPRNLKSDGRDTIPHFEMRRAFAARVEWRMRALDITQSALARQLEISQTTISRWFSAKAGYAIPEGTTMILLPKLLGVSADWLLLGEGPMVRTDAGEAQAFQEGAKTAYAEVAALCGGRLEGLKLGTSLLSGPARAADVDAANYRAGIELARQTQDRAAHQTAQSRPRSKAANHRGTR